MGGTDFQAMIALTLELKRQYRNLLGASTTYGVDKNMTLQLDALGLLLKELEDTLIIHGLKLQENDEDSTRVAG